MRGAWVGSIAFVLVLAGYSLGRAADRDEAVITVQVSSAEHEIQEGYFSLGAETTLIAKPGTDLHRFLTRQNGRKVRISIAEIGGHQLSRLER